MLMQSVLVEGAGVTTIWTRSNGEKKLCSKWVCE